MSRDPVDNLGTALDHLAVIDRHLTSGRLDDQLVFDAVCLRLSSAIESASRLPDEWLAGEFGDEWPQIRATRNLIAHDYRAVSSERLIHVLEHRLSAFTAGLHRLIDRHAPGLEPELP